MHSFNASKKVGDLGEQKLDEFFSSKFDIEEVDMTQQKLGWDRIFVHKERGTRASVEYKTDTLSHKTGNIFVEIWSNKEAEKRGWAYPTTAQWLYYYVTGLNQVFIVDVAQLKLYLENWQIQFKVKTARNPNYTSEGMLVPIEVFKTIAYEVLEV
jgi:hypothetical protein